MIYSLSLLLLGKDADSSKGPESGYHSSVHVTFAYRTEISAILGVIPIVAKRKNVAIRNIDAGVIDRIGGPGGKGCGIYFALGLCVFPIIFIEIKLVVPVCSPDNLIVFLEIGRKGDSSFTEGCHSGGGLQSWVIFLFNQPMGTGGQTVKSPEFILFHPLSHAGSLYLHISIHKSDAIASKGCSSFYIQPFSWSTILIPVNIHQGQGSHVDNLGENIEEGTLGIVFRIVESDYIIPLHSSILIQHLRSCWIDFNSVLVLEHHNPILHQQSILHGGRRNKEQLEKKLVKDKNPEHTKDQGIQPFQSFREEGPLLVLGICSSGFSQSQSLFCGPFNPSKEFVHEENLHHTLLIDKRLWYVYLSLMFKKPQLPEVEPVTLKSYHGIRPGIYILAFFFLAILLLSFLLFLLPGLVSNVSYVTFNEAVMGSGVYEDGIYLGSGNDGVYKTTSGPHTYTFFYEGVEYGRKEVELQRQLFFTLFSHRKTSITSDSSFGEEFVAAAEKAFVRDLASYSAVLEHGSSFHVPPIYETFANNMVLSGVKDITSLWLFGASHVTTEELYEDYLRGREILEGSSIVFLDDSVEKLESILSSIFSGKSERLYGLKEGEVTMPRENGDFFSYPSSTVVMGRSGDLNINGAKEAPILTQVPSFSIARNAVTEHDWALFVEENPMWSASNRDELVSMGLVDSNYLKGINLSPYINSIRPIRNISYYSAAAYVEWKSEKDGVEYHIPTEAEWTLAARSAEDKAYVTSLVYVENNPSTPTAMAGQLWEFTSTPYIPLSRVSDYSLLLEIEKEFGYCDIIVKGGSYVNDPNSVDIHSVGVMDRSFCSDYLGLRLAKYE